MILPPPEFFFKVRWFVAQNYPIGHATSSPSHEVGPDQRWFRIDHLKGKTKYMFQVQARTTIGFSVPHSEMLETKYCKLKFSYIFIEMADKRGTKDSIS